MYNFKDQTCKDCYFRNEQHCVYAPPRFEGNYANLWKAGYPVVYIKAHMRTQYKCPDVEVPEFYQKACSKYVKVNLNKLTT